MPTDQGLPLQLPLEGCPRGAPAFLAGTRDQHAPVDDEAALARDLVGAIVDAWFETPPPSVDDAGIPQHPLGSVVATVLKWRRRAQMVSLARALGVSKRLSRTLRRRFDQAWPRVEHEGTREQQLEHLIDGVLLR